MTREVAVLRADAGHDVGFGHLMRCVALAEGLLAKGLEPVLAMASNGPADSDLAAVRRGVSLERIDAGTSLDQDADATATLVRRLNASLLVTDVCHLRTLPNLPALDAFHRRLKREAAFLVVFAAGHHLDSSADLIVNPYLLTNEGRHVPETSARVLSGPKYFIFRTEFARAAVMPRAISAPVRRIVVAVGGSDPAGLTARIIDALVCAGGGNLEVRVVSGPGTPAAERNATIDRLSRLGSAWTLIDQPNDMASLFLWADLAVTGDGLTKYETAVTGTPSIVVSRPNSDPSINRAFIAGGTTLCVEPGPEGDWASLPATIQRVIADRSVREEMSRRGRQLVDGRGIERVLARLPMVKVA